MYKGALPLFDSKQSGDTYVQRCTALVCQLAVRGHLCTKVHCPYLSASSQRILMHKREMPSSVSQQSRDIYVHGCTALECQPAVRGHLCTRMHCPCLSGDTYVQGYTALVCQPAVRGRLCTRVPLSVIQQVRGHPCTRVHCPCLSASSQGTPMHKGALSFSISQQSCNTYALPVSNIQKSGNTYIQYCTTVVFQPAVSRHLCIRVHCPFFVTENNSLRFA